MKTTPLKHQAEMIQRIPEDCFGLLWEMGLGKTWVSCWSIENDLAKNGFTKPYLVIAPPSVVENWPAEVSLHTIIPEKNICLLRGSREKRIQMLQDSKNIVFIINYEGLLVLKDVLPKMHFRIIFADESHKLKNPKAQTTKIACMLKADARYILSGTPILNSYMDVFSQWLFMDGGETFGTNFYSFRNRYFVDYNAGRFRGNFPDWRLKPGTEETIKALMAKRCHRLEKKDCLNLPEKIYKIEHCYMTAEQMEHYKNLKQECITWIEDKAVTATVMLTRLLRLNQLTSGFLKTADDGEEIRLKTNPKLDLCKDIVSQILVIGETSKTKIEGEIVRGNDGEVISDTTSVSRTPIQYLNDNKIIIWAQFRHDIEMLRDTFAMHNPVVIYGGVKNKQELINTFQNDDKCRIFIGQIASGIGITLTKAAYAIYYSSDFSLGNRKQSEDRNHRKGSEIHSNITYIDLVMKDTIDEYILACVRKKAEMADGIMDYIKKFQLEGGE